MVTKKYYFPFIFMLASFAVMAQDVGKKYLTEADYHLWSELEIKGCSDKGGWVSYGLTYESGNDTLFIKDKSGLKTYAFPKGREGIFGGEDYFACRIDAKKISVMSLKTGATRIYENARQFFFSNDGKTLAVLDESNSLTIEYSGSFFAQIENVAALYPNPSGDAMVYTISKEKSSLHYCPFDGDESHFKKLETAAEATFETIVWNKNGTAFSFVKKYKDLSDLRNGTNLSVYRLNENKCYSLAFGINKTSNFDMLEKTINDRNMVLSDDGKRLLFYAADVQEAKLEKPVVQIWNGNDHWTYSQVQLQAKKKDLYCYVWFTTSDTTLQLTNEKETNLMLGNDSKFAVIYNPTGVTPEFSYINKVALSVKDLKETIRSAPEAKIIAIADEVSTSYGGKFILYRVDEKWFVYEPATAKHTDITKNFPRKYGDVSNDHSGIKPIFGIIGWSKNDTEIIIHDEFDLWSINLDNLKTVRLTKGRETATIFRVPPPFGSARKIPNFDGFTFPLLAIEKGFYLKATGKISKESGYYWWNGNESKIVYRDKTINDLCSSGDNTILFFKDEDFNQAPQLKSINLVTKKEEVIFKSNPQQSNYFWGNSKLINYEDSKGNDLQGALFYPANYNKAKHYPMVVYIYETLSDHLHNYVKPTVLNGGQPNLSTTTSQGYFVLYPDIKHIADNVGFSATDCVIRATQSVIDLGLVQRDKIALVGHSFGGYETAFISTQTGIFCTVVTGAGVSDIVSSYLSIGWNNGRAEIFRYEHDHWRMTKSLFDSMDTYLQNSPITHAKKITVPLLIWSGEQDRQVHYFQSIAFYNALRRLGKKEVLLLYPENRHRLTTSKSQIDFNSRIEEWLGTFLKNEPAPDWIKKALN